MDLNMFTVLFSGERVYFSHAHPTYIVPKPIPPHFIEHNELSFIYEIKLHKILIEKQVSQKNCILLFIQSCCANSDQHNVTCNFKQSFSKESSFSCIISKKKNKMMFPPYSNIH